MLKSCIKNWKRIDDDMAADVAQRECSKIKCYASAFREREREAFVSGKIEIMHGIREGMTILQYEDKNKKSKKQRKIKRQNNSNIESSGDMKS